MTTIKFINVGDVRVLGYDNNLGKTTRILLDGNHLVSSVTNDDLVYISNRQNKTVDVDKIIDLLNDGEVFHIYDSNSGSSTFITDVRFDVGNKVIMISYDGAYDYIS